ncbi:MAG: hypothetical protein JRJ84_03720 [Deltaproteobacteria bacterium]|nr:hypothetical protein [Deltaproteobacteria bacterium]
MRTAASTSPLKALLFGGAVAGALIGCTSDYEVIPEPVDVDPADVTECPFTPISGTQLSVYDCNPVFTTQSGSLEVDSVGFLTTTVVGHPFHQIWFSASGGTGYELHYAASGDGTSWDAHPSNPLLLSQSGAWDQDIMDAIQVVWDPDTASYVMTYQGVTLPTSDWDFGTWGLGVATSPDGVTWTKHAANPVIDFIALAGDGFTPYVSPCWPLALTKAAYGFTGYIGAQYVDPWDFTGTTPACDVYSATASSLASWSLGGNPILSAGGPYDTAGIAGAAVVEHGGLHYMFYIGFEEWVSSGPNTVSSKYHHLNLATSMDGVTWSKSPANPLPVSLTEEGLISGIGAQVVGSRIHLWITDFYESESGQAIGYYLFEPDIDPHP